MNSGICEDANTEMSDVPNEGGGAAAGGAAAAVPAKGAKKRFEVKK